MSHPMPFTFTVIVKLPAEGAPGFQKAATIINSQKDRQMIYLAQQITAFIFLLPVTILVTVNNHNCHRESPRHYWVCDANDGYDDSTPIFI